jgi:hypothetical protein
VGNANRYQRVLWGCAAAFLCISGISKGAEPPRAVPGQKAGKYELWGQLFTPFLQVLSKETASPYRAFEMEVRLEQMTGLPKELAGSKAFLALQAPDKLRVSGPVFGEEITLGRHGQNVWIAPGGRMEGVLDSAAKAGRLPNPDSKYRLGDFCLPFTDKHLAFLPALFQVREYAAEPVDGVDCRVLEVEILEEVGKMLGGNWKLWIWVDPHQKPVRLQVERKDFEASFRVDRLEFSEGLPKETWEGTGDVLRLDPARYGQVMELLVGGRKSKKKK